MPMHQMAVATLSDDRHRREASCTVSQRASPLACCEILHQIVTSAVFALLEAVVDELPPAAVVLVDVDF